MKTVKLLLSKLSVYLALLGILTGIILITILNRKDPIPQPIAMPSLNPFKNAIAASGIVESLDRNIALGTPVPGLVKKVMVQVGDYVKKGQILFEIDDRDLQATLVVEKANAIVAKANAQRVQDQLERLKSVQDPRAVSLEEVKTRQNDVFIALAQLKAAEALVKQTEILISRLSIKAPSDGIILQNNIREGEFLSLSQTQPPILLGDLSRLQVRADIDEENASSFNTKQPAIAYPKNNTTLKIPLTFNRLEPYVVPKMSLTGSGDERVDTRVLQVLYSFEEPEDFHVYVGQQLDVFIQKEASP